MKIEEILRQEIILYMMIGLFATGVLAKMISHFAVCRLVRSAENIHKSNQRLMKLVKAKFEHASIISDRVQNVRAFVDKYLYGYRVLGVRIENWRILYKKILWAVATLGLVQIFRSYQANGFGADTLQAVEITVGMVMVLSLFAYGTGDNLKLEAAKNYMVEYLENVCVHRYQKAGRPAAEIDIPLSEGEPTDVSTPAESGASEEAAGTADGVVAKGFAKEKSDENEQEMRIRAILQEFLA